MKFQLSASRRLGMLLVVVFTLTLSSVNPSLAQHTPESNPIDGQTESQPLIFEMYCNGRILDLTIQSGDGPFQLMMDAYTVNIPSNHYAGEWPLIKNAILSELGGDQESMSLGTVDCSTNRALLQAAITCEDGNLVVRVIDGDWPFVLNGEGPGLPLYLSIGTVTLQGPAIWRNLQLAEGWSDYEAVLFGTRDCTNETSTPPSPEPLSVRCGCNGNNAWFRVDGGDTEFILDGSGPGLPVLLLSDTLHSLVGPGTWSDLVIKEASGNYEQLALPQMICPSSPETVIGLPDDVLTRIMALSAEQPQWVYDRPGGDPLRNADNHLILLPHDADGSGYDTFMVLESQRYEGEVWVGVFLGGPQLGWLPLVSLTPTIE